MLICIYCLSPKGPFDGREHVIPQAFGKFGTATPTLQCVCDECNSFFGKEMDQNLARQTIEGVSRYARNQLSSEKRRAKKLYIRLGKEVGELAGLRIEIDGTTGELCLPLPQLHAYNFVTESKDAFLLEEIENIVLPPEIYGGPSGQGHPHVWKLSIWTVTDVEYEQVRNAARAAGIHFDFPNPVALSLSKQNSDDNSILVEISGEVDTPPSFPEPSTAI